MLVVLNEGIDLADTGVAVFYTVASRDRCLVVRRFEDGNSYVEDLAIVESELAPISSAAKVVEHLLHGWGYKNNLWTNGHKFVATNGNHAFVDMAYTDAGKMLAVVTFVSSDGDIDNTSTIIKDFDLTELVEIIEKGI